jgi:hypothetical protein
MYLDIIKHIRKAKYAASPAPSVGCAPVEVVLGLGVGLEAVVP